MADTGNYQKIFPTRLRETMARLKMTQAELGEKLDPPKSRQSISAYCDGKNTPDWEVAASIAKALGVSLDWLCGIEDKEATQGITAFQWLCFMDCLHSDRPMVKEDNPQYPRYHASVVIDSEGGKIDFWGSAMVDFFRKYDQLGQIEDIDEDIIRELKEKLFHKYERYFTPGYREIQNEEDFSEVLGDDLPF